MIPNGLDRSGHCPNWQSIFVRDNLLVLGYFAWVGLHHPGGRLLVCNVELPPVGTDLRLYTWKFTTQLIPDRHLFDGLLAMAIPPSEIPDLVNSIIQSNPQREMMLLLRFGKLVEILWLKNLAITPPECYSQVCDRWDEFMSHACTTDLPEYLSMSLLDVPLASQENKQNDDISQSS